MVKKRIFLLTMVIIVLLFVTSCSSEDLSDFKAGVKEGIQNNEENQDNTETKKMISNDQKYEIVLGKGWESLEGMLLEDAEIEAGNLVKEQYLVLHKFNTSDFNMDLNEFTQLTMDTMAVDDAEIGQSVPLKIDKKDAIVFEVKGVYNNINIQYWIYTIDCEDEYVQIMTWTLLSKADENKDILEKAALSFSKITTQ